MKQSAKILALCCALLAPLSFAATAPPVQAASAAEIWLEWTSTSVEPAQIPLDIGDREAFVTIHVDNDCFWSMDDDISNVQVQWNGETVPGGDVVKVGSSIVFRIQGSGSLSINNLNTGSYSDPWSNTEIPYSATGSVVISVL